MLIGPLERARLREGGYQSRLLGELLARRACRFRFGVTRLGDGRRAAVARQLQDLAFEGVTLPRNRELVSYTYRVRGLDALAVHMDFAAGHRLGCNRP